MYMSRIFGLYGELCAVYPWEVIVAVMTLTACLFSFEQSLPFSKRLPNCTGCPEEDHHYIGTDAVVMTVFRCIAILYSYHQFKNMNKIGSKYILFIAGLFTVFSSFVFTSTVLNVMKTDLVDLKDAIFFFLLLIDSSKAVTLAQFASTASNQEEINEKISRGMAVLGPTITLDSIVEILVIGIGTLSGVHRLEILSYYACLSVLVNYVIFMTFYPACLSIILELSKVPIFHNRCDAISNMLEENQKSNPAVQRVKMIMSLGLTVVHVYSYWCFVDENVQTKTNNTTGETNGNNLQDYSFYRYIMRQLTLSADHVVILILLLTLVIKFTFFGARNQITEELCVKSSKQDVSETCQLIQKPKMMENVEVQTETYQDVISISSTHSKVIDTTKSRRSLEECLQIYRAAGADILTDEEIILLIDTKHIACYDLEKALKNPERGIEIRRRIIENTAKCSKTFTKLPYHNYDYSKVNSCCENVVGCVPIPLGLAGPLRLDDKLYFIPMATTEGCLVASTNRGCRAVEKTGIISRVEGKGIAITSFVEFPSITNASDVKSWIEQPGNFIKIKESFNLLNRSISLLAIKPKLRGPYLYIRFIAETGDAINMLTLSKYVEKALKLIKTTFPEMKIISVNSNDKKHSALNWVEGNGKSVVCECIIPSEIVSSVLKTSTHRLVELNLTKNHYGSSIAGSIGGNNAQASNIVTAIYIATGQDTAQNVGSSNCMTIMKPYGDDGQDLYASCTMPSIVVGTAGGGTVLPAQSSCLELLGVKGHHQKRPGENADQLARIVCAAVLAGELSLMAALDTGDLVRSHLRYNRSYSESEGRKQISFDKTS